MNRALEVLDSFTHYLASHILSTEQFLGSILDIAWIPNKNIYK